MLEAPLLVPREYQLSTARAEDMYVSYTDFDTTLVTADLAA